MVDESGSRVTLEEAMNERDAVLRAFVTQDGSLRSVPTKLRKRLVVLDYVARQLDPARTYSELDINVELRRFDPDVAALRRYLVDEGFMTRSDGTYRRVEVR